MLKIHAIAQPELCHNEAMVNTVYSVIATSGGNFDVQMAKPGGLSKMVTGFGSEHEANAWVVQAKRMKRDAAPWTPLVPRKPGATTEPPSVDVIRTV